VKLIAPTSGCSTRARLGSGAGHEVDYARRRPDGGQAGLERQRELVHQQRVLRRGLHDDRVAGEQGGGDLADHGQQREVVRTDASHDADRHPAYAADQAGGRRGGGQVEDVGRPGAPGAQPGDGGVDLQLAGHGDGCAGVPDRQVDQVIPPGGELVPGHDQYAPPHVQRGLRPDGERLRRGRHGRRHLGSAAVRHRGDHLLGVGVSDLVGRGAVEGGARDAGADRQWSGGGDARHAEDS